MKIHSRTLLPFFAVILTSCFTDVASEPDVSARLACDRIGKGPPSYYNSNSQDHESCKKKMLELFPRLDENSVVQIAYALKNPTSLEEMEEAVNLFSTYQWNPTTISNVMKVTTFGNTNKMELLKKLVQFGNAPWWSQIFDDTGFNDAKSFNIQRLMTDLLENTAHLTYFGSYYNWWKSQESSCQNKVNCNEYKLLQVIKFLASRNQPAEKHEVNDIFKEICANKESKWTVEDLKTFLLKAKNFGLRNMIQVLKQGNLLVTHLILHPSAWTVDLLLTEVDKCKQIDCVKPTINAVIGSYNMSVVPSSFDNIIKTLDLLRIKREDALKFISDMNTPIEDLPVGTPNEDVEKYFISLYCAKSSFTVDEDKEVSNAIDSFVKSALAKRISISVQNEYLKMAAAAQFHPKEYDDFLSMGGVTFTVSNISNIMTRFKDWDLTGVATKNIFTRLKEAAISISDINAKLDLLDTKINPGIASDTAVYSYFNSAVIKPCDTQFIKRLAVYNAAIGFTMTPQNFSEVYSLICGTTAYKTNGILDTATQNRQPLNELIVKLK